MSKKYFLNKINWIYRIWKQTFKTIHQLSCFVGHPVWELEIRVCGKYSTALWRKIWNSKNTQNYYCKLDKRGRWNVCDITGTSLGHLSCLLRTSTRQPFFNRNWVFVTNYDFLISISLQPNAVDLTYFKLC